MKAMIDPSLLLRRAIAGIAGHRPRRGCGYIPARRTLADARRSGQSLGDYVEALWGAPGSSRAVIDRIAALGVFDNPVGRVVEIGAGTGRYLEKTLQQCTPDAYESYETDDAWAKYLASNYPVDSRDADGESLGETNTSSVDLVQAHGVFVYLPFLTACAYWKEMVRVAAPGAHVVFDALTESCFGDDRLSAWLASRSRYPTIVPRDFVVAKFARHGFRLRGSFHHPYGAGISEYFVFQREMT